MEYIIGKKNDLSGWVECQNLDYNGAKDLTSFSVDKVIDQSSVETKSIMLVEKENSEF